MNVPIVREQSSSSISVDLDINNGSDDADNVNDWDNRSSIQSHFIT
jgi:hypothetical protein